MAPEPPYFGPAYDYEVDPEFRPSYLHLERDVPSLPVEPGIVVRPVLGNRLNMSFIYFEPHTVAPVHRIGRNRSAPSLTDPSSLSLLATSASSIQAMSM
jgi:hypothetical protein